MKTSFLLIATIFFLTACQKDMSVLPEIVQKTPVVASVNTKPDSVVKVKQDTVTKVQQDTMPAGAAFKIELYKDGVNHDDVMILFKQQASANYDPMEDGLAFWGNGQVNLASTSVDGRDLAINTLPYIPGMTIGLDMRTKADGAFTLQLDYQKNLPSTSHIWLKDAYLKDSVDVRTKSYQFNVIKADSNSFGSSRFKLVIKNGTPK